MYGISDNHLPDSIKTLHSIIKILQVINKIMHGIRENSDLILT